MIRTVLSYLVLPLSCIYSDYVELILTPLTRCYVTNQNPLATKQVLDEDGWINTGDIGWITPYHSVGRSRHSGGVIVLEGRAKDTIVLSTGSVEVIFKKI